MTKQAFLEQLRKKLSGLPRAELAEQLAFYSEMIDDRMEEGLSEEEAVAAVGLPVAIAGQATAEKAPVKRRMKGWEIVLLVLGSPVWVPLLAAAAVVVLSVYISLWAVVVSLWSAVFALQIAGIFTVVVAVVSLIIGGGAAIVALLGAALVCTGLSIFLFFACRAATKGICRVTVLTVQWVKTRFGKGSVGHG